MNFPSALLVCVTFFQISGSCCCWITSPRFTFYHITHTHTHTPVAYNSFTLKTHRDIVSVPSLIQLPPFVCHVAPGGLNLGKKISVPKDVMMEELNLPSNRGSRMFQERQRRVERFTLENATNNAYNTNNVRKQQAAHNTLLIFLECINRHYHNNSIWKMG